MDDAPRPVRWMGSSRKDLKTFPKLVQRHVGQALWAAQRGEEYPTVKALKGFGGRSVLEIVAAHESDTYRGMYTVRFHGAIMDFLTALGQDVQITVRPTRKEHGHVSVVVV